MRHVFNVHFFHSFFPSIMSIILERQSADRHTVYIQCNFDYLKNKKSFRSEMKIFFLFSKVLSFRQQKQTNSTQYIQCNCFRHVNCLSFLFFDLNYIEWYNSGEKLIKQQFRPFKDATHLHFSRHICLGLSLIANWCFPSDSFPFCERLDQKKTD